MIPHVIVIDDFRRNPEVVREKALNLTYKVEGRYPGLNSVEKINIDGLDRTVSQLVYEPVRAPWTRDFSHGSCRVSLASDDDKPARIHIDQSHWSGILFLSRPEDCRGGTDFFRHLPTNTDHLPLTPKALAETGYSSYEGLRAERSAESVGRLTTLSVVQSIFLIIITDAAFSIAFSKLGI